MAGGEVVVYVRPLGGPPGVKWTSGLARGNMQSRGNITMLLIISLELYFRIVIQSKFKLL